MANYARLNQLVLSQPANATASDLAASITPFLIEVWMDDYARSASVKDVVETSSAGFSYLFDVSAGRLIAAWGVSRGKHTAPRDKARMAGHPNGMGPRYHRGHAIPHTLGGPTDINLVAQKGEINIGPFRELERRAVANEGALYFSHWIYRDATNQTPVSVEQGLVMRGRAVELRWFTN